MTLKTRTQTRDVGSLTLRAEVGSVNKEKRTVDVMFSTGARVLRQSYWDGPSYEELSLEPAHVRMKRIASGTAPFLTDHRSGIDNVVGVISSARLENGKGIATVRFPTSGIDTRADQLFSKIEDGIIRSVSVGYLTYKTEKVGVEGDAKTPVFRATDWEPYEISAVALPAEVGAGFRSESTQSNPCVFVTREEENDVNEEEKKAAAEAAKLAADRARAEELAKSNRELEERAAKVERERISSIQAVCRKYALGETFERKLVDDKSTLEQARAAMMAEIEKREIADPSNVPSGNGIEVGESDREKFVRGASAAILSRAGVMPMLLAAVASSKAQTRNAALGVRQEFKNFDPEENGGALRAFNLRGLARESLERRGINTRRMSDHDMVGKALTLRSDGMFTRDGLGDATISDFAVVLENVMYKTLLGSYQLADDTWKRFCGTDSVQDFRNSNRYRTGSFGTLDLKPEAAEYKHKAIPDGAKLAINVQTYGNMIAVSREAIINDDMGAITDTMSKFGRAAGLTIEKAVFDLLLTAAGLGPTVTYNGTTAPFFDAGFANVGAGSALTMAAIEANRVIMASQKDISSNEYLNLRPSVLLVPIGLEGLANQINRAKFDPTNGSAFESPNIVGGLFREVVGTPRLTGTRRYMFSDAVEAIKVVFLNGAQTPFMEQKTGWNVDGTEMKLRLDAKAQMFDPKGALTDAGA